MQAVELFEHKYQTPESRRTQVAAKCLVWLLGKEGKEIDPDYIQLADEKTPIVVDVMVERDLRKVLKDALAESQLKLDSWLLDDSEEGRMLREWWRVDAHGLRDYSVDPMLLVRRLTPTAVNGMIPLYHIAGTTLRFTTERDERGYVSRPDPTSFTHDLMVRLDKLEVRTHTDAGGEVKFLTYATEYHNDKGEHTSTTYDIIRSEANRLVTGDPKKSNHLPGWQRPAPPVEKVKS